MSTLHVLGGIFCLCLGVFIIVKQSKTFIKGQQDRLGFDIKLLGGGIGFVIIGIAILAKYL